MLTAVFATLNARFLRMPQAIGLTMMGALASALVIAVSKLVPGLAIHDWARRFVAGLDFKTTLLDGLLSFLLFAGAFQIDLHDMRGGRWAVLALSVFGTLLSTAIVGFGLKGILMVLGGPSMPLA